MTTMIVKKANDEGELYAIFYIVHGSLAGQGQLMKEYFWEGPYTEMQTALQKAEALKIAYQNDDSFVVKRYKGLLEPGDKK